MPYILIAYFIGLVRFMLTMLHNLTSKLPNLVQQRKNVNLICRKNIQTLKWVQAQKKTNSKWKEGNIQDLMK